MFPFCSCVCQNYRNWLIISNDANVSKTTAAEQISFEIVIPKSEANDQYIIPDLTKSLSIQSSNNKSEVNIDTGMNLSQITDVRSANNFDHAFLKQDMEKNNLMSKEDVRLLSEVNHVIDKRRLLKIQRSKKVNKRRLSFNCFPNIRICNPDRFGLVDLCNWNLTQKYLKKYLTSWDFNIFRLNRFTGGRSTLVDVGISIFQCQNLTNHFRFEYDNLKAFMYSVQSVYHSYNPYHNALHSADVAQSMHCFLSDYKIKAISSPVEVIGCLIAALCHDADHPGINQPYLEKINHFFVSLYNHCSVLENHHIQVTLSLIHQSNLLNFLSADDWRTVVTTICNLILATDITHQKSYLNRFIGLNQEKKCLPYSDCIYSTEEKTLIYQMAMKCSDISNPCRCWPVTLGWASLVCEEFFIQGDVEKKMGLSVLSTHDRCMSSKADIQLGFIRFIVKPLVTQWNCFLTSNLSITLVKHVEFNLNSWELFRHRFGAISSKTLQPQSVKTESALQPVSGLATLTEETTLASPCITKHRANYQRRLSLPDTVTNPIPNLQLKKTPHNSSTTIVTFPRISNIPGSCRRGSLPQHPRTSVSVSSEPNRRRGSLPLTVRAFPVPSAWEDTSYNKSHTTSLLKPHPLIGDHLRNRRGSAPLIGYPRCSVDFNVPRSSLVRGCSREQMLLEVYWMTASSSFSSVNSCIGASNNNLHLLSSIHQSSSSSSSRNDSGTGGFVTIH